MAANSSQAREITWASDHSRQRSQRYHSQVVDQMAPRHPSVVKGRDTERGPKKMTKSRPGLKNPLEDEGEEF